MNIESVHIRNFRKLKNCHIDFGEKGTVFVGANNSGKTSAISAIVWFLKNTERFTLKEFTATNWASIDNLGDKWLAKKTIDEALLNAHNWDDIVPSMDIWINLADEEQYRVNHLIPSLSTWDGKRVGVRGQYVPKDVTRLYFDYKKAKEKVLALQDTEEWKKASSPDLFPRNLCDFLGKGSFMSAMYSFHSRLLLKAFRSTVTASLPQEVVIFAHAYTDTLTPADSTKAANTPKSFLFAFIYVDNHFNAPNMHFLEQQRC